MSKRSSYIPAIDGLRAIAVIAVLLYHLDLSFVPGGFLGVDLFFCISGYVITRQLLDSVLYKGALDLREFYLARLRRLVPALLFVLIGGAIAIALWAPDGIHRYLDDLPYVLTGTENWHLVAIHQDYFSQVGRAPLLQHTWSLAVEAQFYLIWPLIILATLRFFGKARVALTALVIAGLSGAILFAYSYSMDSHGSSAVADRISHVYFGTDTHSLGLFLGSALAVSWIPQNLHTDVTRRAQDFIDGIGIVGLLGLISTFVVINEGSSIAYQASFPLAGLFGCATIISIVHPASRVAPILKHPFLTWIGKRSYAIYLWHWVVFELTRPTSDLAGSVWAIDIARVLLVLALSEISLVYIERPVRSGRVEDWIRGRKYRIKKVAQRQRAILVAVPSIAAVLFGASVAAALVQDHSVNASNLAILRSQNAAAAKSVAAHQSSGETTKLWVTGDSIILGSAPTLEKFYPVALLNARVGRQIGELINVVTADKPGLAGDPVVLDIGNNNHLTSADVHTLLELVKDQPRIVVVNTAVPRTYREDNDKIIAAAVAQYPKAILVDWNSISQGHPEYFVPDGVHLSSQGITVYVDSIVQALNQPQN